jgi:hypothetical protein
MDSGTFEPLLDVWGTSGRDVYAVGDHGAMIHYDGKLWSKVETGLTGTLHGIWGSTRGEMFVVGREGVILSKRE